MKLKEPVVNEVIDIVESGLGDTKEGRALFITLTESTWSVVSTVTTDLTTSASCIDTSITECTTATARSDDLQQDVSNGPAILTRVHTGEKVDVHAIKPSKTQGMFDRMPRIIIPTVSSAITNLPSTTYSSTVTSTTYTFASSTGLCTTSGYTGALSSMSVCT